ncbi:hypothetical protein BDZ45DRAFT_741356 [Acephala macrosclerotiorum]|nr:hypothetical protein BDZ45DRAFT_741356 [Acephala macrosclerotiorum]
MSQYPVPHKFGRCGSDFINRLYPKLVERFGEGKFLIKQNREVYTIFLPVLFTQEQFDDLLTNGAMQLGQTDGQKEEMEVDEKVNLTGDEDYLLQVVHRKFIDEGRLRRIWSSDSAAIGSICDVKRKCIFKGTDLCMIGVPTWLAANEHETLTPENIEDLFLDGDGLVGGEDLVGKKDQLC